MAHFSPLLAAHCAATATPQEISNWLRDDEALISAQGNCSWLAYYLPEYETERGLAIATCLTPSPALGHDIKKLIYKNVLSRIRRHLKRGGSNTTPDETVHEIGIAERAIPHSELSTTLRVIAHLQEAAIIQRDTTASTIMAWLEERVALSRHTISESAPHEAEIPRPPPTPRKRFVPPESSLEEQTGAAGSADILDMSYKTTTQVEPYTKSSWVQSISEIPYEDVGSALSVNTFVPFILCRELLPLMGCSSIEKPTKPQGYIINVSSREGIFESHTSSSAKRGKHVHTNMSKAALNMLTETEAEPAWRKKRIAMNTVDPGYMSAAPEYEDAFEGMRPIGWEDGAGRVLWPIAVAEMGERVVWGRFLKHYGAVEGGGG
ncbi:unnamed protein product [Alternaria alternata]